MLVVMVEDVADVICSLIFSSHPPPPSLKLPLPFPSVTILRSFLYGSHFSSLLCSISSPPHDTAGKLDFHDVLRHLARALNPK